MEMKVYRFYAINYGEVDGESIYSEVIGESIIVSPSVDEAIEYLKKTEDEYATWQVQETIEHLNYIGPRTDTFILSCFFA